MLRRILLIAVIALLPAPSRAARLPFRVYGASEGLAGDHVRFILQDARGFLWLATNAGVSRFDGHDFRNYGPADGLPFASARKVVEATDGTLFVLGGQKVARRRITPAPGAAEFEPVNPPDLPGLVGDVLDIVACADGSLVVAGEKGAARLRGEELEPIDLGPVQLPDRTHAANAWAAAIDADGALWIARTYGITHIGRDGNVLVLPLPRGRAVESGWGWLPSMTVDRSGRVWLLTVDAGAMRLALDARGHPTIVEVLDEKSGLGSRFVRALHQAADGALWLAFSNYGLARGEPTAQGWRFVRVGPEEGLPDLEVSSVSTDAQGNLWAGTGVAGVVRLAADGLTSWGTAEGLTPASISAILDDPAEGLVVVNGNFHFVAMRDGGTDDQWGVSSEIVPGWGGDQVVARGGDGRLWMATAKGLAVYAPGTRIRDLQSRRPERMVSERDGLPGSEVHRVFAARDGTVWFGLIHVASGVCRIRSDGTGLRCFGREDGLTAPAEGAAFAEDAGGNLWVGLYEGGVFRHRDGRFESWPGEPGRQIAVRSIRRDDAGRVWVAGVPGLLRIDAPESAQPSFHRTTMDDGLAANETVCTAEDRFGHIYVGSVHGVDCMDTGGMIRRFTTADGLPSNRVEILHRDPEGVIWVGTSRGLARLVPRLEAAPTPPRVYLTGVNVAGTPRAPKGPLDLASGERTVEFAFTAPSFRAGETMRFQWRLAGSGDDWTPPGAARAITFAALSPGRYRFDVRAVDGEGLVSVPSSFDFTIRPPFWRSAWFAATIAIAFAAISALVYRLRVARLIELERVRTRIATDLHDDIGASLSQIAVLSQYATRQAARGAAEARDSLERITELAGSVVDAMSDVVWSINPSRDRMSDLVHRMRRFAVDLFSDGDTVLTLDLPEDSADERLDPESRRQVYLVFKEALRNASRHAGARQVEVSLKREGGGLLLAVRDDGAGMDDSVDSGGSGLASMRERAAQIGGTLTIRPREGGGSEVLLRIASHLDRARGWRRNVGS